MSLTTFEPNDIIKGIIHISVIHYPLYLIVVGRIEMKGIDIYNGAMVVIMILISNIHAYSNQWKKVIEEKWNDDMCYTLLINPDYSEKINDHQYSYDYVRSNSNRLGPFKFGRAMNVDIDPSRYGKWFNINQDDSGLVIAWKLRIHSPGAASLNIVCDKFILPPDSEIYIISPYRNESLGPFTIQDNLDKFSMLPMSGDCLDIEYFRFIQSNELLNNRNDCDIIAEINNEMMDVNLQLHIEKIVRGFENNMVDNIYNNINSANFVKKQINEHDINRTVKLAGLHDFEPEKYARVSKSGHQHALSGSCHINSPTCAEALSWLKQSSSVALMMIPECDGYCTGCLLNNPLEDGKQLFLTAYHCLEGGIHESRYKNKVINTTNEYSRMHDYILTVFNYQADKCHNTPDNDNSNSDETYFSQRPDKCQIMMENSVRGLKVLAWSEIADIALCEIVGEIPESLNVYMAGFSISDRVPPKYCVGFHHPSGDVKKMCISKSPVQKHCWDPEECDSGHKYHWIVQNWTFGATEVGSSGSPLFDHKGLVIGELRGGESSCTTRSGYDIYGSISSAYHDFGFSKYLNPTNIKDLEFVNGRHLNDIRKQKRTRDKSQDINIASSMAQLQR